MCLGIKLLLHRRGWEQDQPRPEVFLLTRGGVGGREGGGERTGGRMGEEGTHFFLPNGASVLLPPEEVKSSLNVA